MGRISDELLIKAKRDISKLVKVQRMVTRGGKTFPQDVYVLPSQVKATDKVIGNQQNLLPQMGSVPKPAAGVLDAKYFDSIKSDRTKALDYLKSCGIQWTVSGHAGVDWMRAMQAYKTAAGIQNTSQASSSTAAQGNTQQTVSTAQSAQNTQSGGVTLTAAQQAQVDAGKNGKEKVVILKKILGADGCLGYAKQLGITWDEIGHAAINNMRMTVALKAHFDALDGTVSPTGKDGGAPKGNQNAKKDVVQPTPPSDKLEIPANATERQKNMINLINNIDDVKKLEMVRKSGFIPEDSESYDFVEKKLWKAYDTDIIPKIKGASGSTQESYYSSYHSFESDFSEVTSKVFKGLTKKVIKMSADRVDMHSHNFMAQIAAPGRAISVYHGTSVDFPGGSDSSMVRMLGVFDEASAYEVDEWLCTGYQGKDAEERAKHYDKDKEGFVRLLNHIGETQPELKAEAEKMAQEYDELLGMCNKDRKLLEEVLSNDWIAINEWFKDYQGENEAIQVVKDAMKSNGFTDEEIEATLSSTEWGILDWHGTLNIKANKTDGYGVYKKDASGNRVTFDISKLKTADGVDVTSYLRGSNSHHRDLHEIYKGMKTSYATPISEDTYNEIIDKACKLFGTKIVDSTTHSAPAKIASQRSYSDHKECAYIPDLTEERGAVLMNLSYAYQGMRLRGNISRFKGWCPPSAANQQGNDFTGNFDYYSPNFGGMGKSMTKSEEIAQVNKQVSQIKTYSLDYHKKIKEYVEHEGSPVFKRSYYGKYDDPHDAKIASTSLGTKKLTSSSFTTDSNPAVDMLVDQLVDTAVYCPQNFNSRVTSKEKMDVDVRKRLGHSAYTFTDYNLGGMSGTDVKDLRQKALAAAHCTLAFVDPQKRQEIEHEVKINFDRVDTNGKRVPKSQRVYDDRTLVFHSGVYEVKNSVAAEELEKEAKRLGEATRHSYHGTSYAGGCGIVGVDGRFRFKKQDMLPGQDYTGTMLGDGIYAAKMVGKNCPYIGKEKYSYKRHTTSDTDTSGKCDGVLLVCDTVFGNYKEFGSSGEAERNNKNNGGKYDSVAVGAGALMQNGSPVLEYECVVTRNNMIAPRYMIDCGARRR